MNCNDAVAALIASLESGSAMTDEQREHIRSCERCRELLESAKQFQSVLAGEPVAEASVDAAAVEQAVRREHLKSLALKVAILVAVLAAIVYGVWRRMADGPGAPGTAEIVMLIVGGAAIAIIPFVVLYLVVRSVVRRHGKPLYRRLHPARWWLGVCTGLSEATGQDLTLFRIAFFVLTMFDGIGLLLYILLALAMPVHPADREYLWRFQAKKLLARMRG